MSDLSGLKKKYNAALVRYHNMEKWCETASKDEQEKYADNVFEVINRCNRLLNQIKEIDKLVTPGEILNGFKEV